YRSSEFTVWARTHEAFGLAHPRFSALLGNAVGLWINPAESKPLAILLGAWAIWIKDKPLIEHSLHNLVQQGRIHNFTVSGSQAVREFPFDSLRPLKWVPPSASIPEPPTSFTSNSSTASSQETCPLRRLNA